MSEPTNPVQLFSEMLGSPLGELISSVGQGVGDAQAALDQGALEQTLEIYDLSKDDEKTDAELKLLKLIREIGYQPTFYTIPETEVEAQISLSLDLKSEQASPIGGTPLSKFKVNATPLNAGNMNRFGLQANAMAKLKFKIVPVPPPQNIVDIRYVPDLVGPISPTDPSPKTWNETTKELLDNLGFTVLFKTQEGDLITDETLVEGLAIFSQTPDAGTIANTANVPLELTFQDLHKVPDLSTLNWNSETEEIIEDLGFTYAFKTPEGDAIIDETLVEGLLIGSQSPLAGSIANASNTPIEIVFEDLHKVPTLIGTYWSSEEEEIIENLGFTYQLFDADSLETITFEEANGYLVQDQSLASGTFAYTGDTINVFVNTNDM
ncbi:hypothetical protein [Fluviicola sp.]|uniref:hypothetical protein n=1 Tax=Fluviicola sp. TaxID=1917219 RepID=UPI0031D9C4D1